MRLSNEEFTSEVFRRSDAYIVKRAKRTRIIASCIPVVLCVSVLVMSRYPVMESADQAAPESIMEDTEISKENVNDTENMFADDSYPVVLNEATLDGVVIVSATITQEGAASIIVDATYMAELVEWLDNHMESEVREEDENSLTSESVADDMTETLVDKKANHYIITLLDVNGQEIRLEFPKQMPNASEEDMNIFLELIETILSE